MTVPKRAVGCDLAAGQAIGHAELSSVVARGPGRNSIGIAVIGVIFFALLGTQSGAAANTVAPALRSGAVAAGVPARGAGALVAHFRTCLHDRLVAADPTVTPASCRLPAGQVPTRWAWPR